MVDYYQQQICLIGFVLNVNVRLKIRLSLKMKKIKRFKKVMEYEKYKYSFGDVLITADFVFMSGIIIGLIGYGIYRLVWRNFIDRKIYYVEDSHTN